MRRRRAEHYHRPRRFAHNVAEGLNAIELRHVDVHRHKLRIERVHLAQGVLPIASRAYDAELARLLEDLRDEATHECTVVDYQYRGYGCRALAESGSTVR